MKDLRMYIDGQFCQSSNDQWIDVLNPSTEEVISRQPNGTIEDVNRALDAARAAQKGWAKTPAVERAAWLKKLANGIREVVRSSLTLSCVNRERPSHGLPLRLT